MMAETPTPPHTTRPPTWILPALERAATRGTSRNQVSPVRWHLIQARVARAIGWTVEEVKAVLTQPEETAARTTVRADLPTEHYKLKAELVDVITTALILIPDMVTDPEIRRLTSEDVKGYYLEHVLNHRRMYGERGDGVIAWMFRKDPEELIRLTESDQWFRAPQAARRLKALVEAENLFFNSTRIAYG